ALAGGAARPGRGGRGAAAPAGGPPPRFGGLARGGLAGGGEKIFLAPAAGPPAAASSLARGLGNEPLRPASPGMSADSRAGKSVTMLLQLRHMKPVGGAAPQFTLDPHGSG